MCIKEPELASCKDELREIEKKKKEEQGAPDTIVLLLVCLCKKEGQEGCATRHMTSSIKRRQERGDRGLLC